MHHQLSHIDFYVSVTIKMLQEVLCHQAVCVCICQCMHVPPNFVSTKSYKPLGEILPS